MNKIGSLNVCVVDDTEGFLNSFEEIVLRIPEIDLLGKFLSPEEALDKLLKLHVDFVFVDIRMPKLNGFEFTYQLLKKQPNVKVVLVSDLENPRFHDLAKKVGAQLFIPKEKLSKETILKVLF